MQKVLRFILVASTSMILGACGKNIRNLEQASQNPDLPCIENHLADAKPPAEVPAETSGIPRLPPKSDIAQQTVFLSVESLNGTTQNCVGAVVGDRWIATLASCFPYPVTLETVRVKAYFAVSVGCVIQKNTESEMSRNAVSLHVAEHYPEGTYLLPRGAGTRQHFPVDDLALVELDRPIPQTAKIAELAPADFSLPLGQKIVYSGYAAADGLSQACTEGILHIKESDYAPTFQHSNQLGTEPLFSSAPQVGMQIATGDGGGPVFTWYQGRYVQIGMNLPASSDSNSMFFVSLPKYRKWIHRVMQDPEHQQYALNSSNR